jgi:hypothetical protein
MNRREVIAASRGLGPRRHFATLTARDRIPAAFANRDHVTAGG